MHFTKVHGLGNDFVLVEAFKGRPVQNLPALARQVCNRNFGVGADGLVFLEPSQIADLFMRIYNADGSEAEMCGNALRCVAKYAYERGLCRWPELSIETLAGVKTAKLQITEGLVETVTIDMGVPTLHPERIPFLTDQNPAVLVPVSTGDIVYRVTAVSMGNPHAVVFVPDLNKVNIAREGQGLETHPLFPRGTNVEFVQILSTDKVKVGVWERGVGLTLACGSGACAVGVACILNGLTEDRLTVCLPGGELTVHWRNNKHVYMTGQASIVYSGVWHL